MTVGGGPSTPTTQSWRTTRTSATTSCSTSTSTATTAAASVLCTRAGRAWWPSCSSRGGLATDDRQRRRRTMTYDAIVIGSGQAGNPLSQKLTDYGWTVALIEKEHLGGTCVNTGCTPTKTMIASAQVAHYARHANVWGVQAGDVRVYRPSVVARKDRIVNQWRAGVERGKSGPEKRHPYRGAGR